MDRRDFSSLNAQHSASVVNIVAVRPSSANQDRNEEVERADLFRQLSPSSHGLPPPTAYRVTGCGLILTSDGYILTNAHLVSGASIIDVETASGEHDVGRLIGVDRATDLAVLKIVARDLPVVALGSSERLTAGQWVAAIGSPFGFRHSLVAGVVSAIERIVPGDDSYVPFIQTDLPLNPGNSGGPLFDLAGNVVGINTETVFSEHGSAGISFAIPIDLAHRVATELIRSGHVDRADLGIRFQDLDPQLARVFGSPPGGVLLHTVTAHSPAERAGLKVGDIVLAFQGRTVVSARQFAAAIAAQSPGSVTELTIWRDNARSEVRVEAVQASLRDAKPREVASHSSPSGLLDVHPMTATVRRLLGTEGHLLVVATSEQAAAAGIEVGDIILAVDTKPLRTEGELRRALTSGSTQVALLIDRDGRRLFIAVELQ
jgi:serine protease Do